jgi:hypothetical protein
MNQPNKAVALDICKSLLETLNKEQERLNKFRDDPQGDTLALGVAIFFGIFLSGIKGGIKNREFMTDAALGYSMTADEVQRDLDNREYQR